MDLLNSTGNYIEYPIMEKNLNNYTHTYHFAVNLKLTQPFKLTVLQFSKRL